MTAIWLLSGARRTFRHRPRSALAATVVHRSTTTAIIICDLAMPETFTDDLRPGGGRPLHRHSVGTLVVGVLAINQSVVVYQSRSIVEEQLTADLPIVRHK